MSESVYEVRGPLAGPAEGAGDDAASEAGVSTGAVARRLGVSPTTLRSWDRRYGIGPAAREDGRHRRWTPADVAMLEEMCRLTAAGVPPAEVARAARDRPAAPPGPPAPFSSTSTSVPSVAVPFGLTTRSAPATGPVTPTPGARRPSTARVLPLGNVRSDCRGLSRAAVRLDAPLVDELLASFVAAYGLLHAWEDVMVPTLRAVGRTWEAAGDKYVEVEHLLSWHISSVLRRVPPAPPRRTDTGPVLLACVPGEQHTLPIEALNAVLAEHGLPTRMFGAAVPATALDEAARRVGPRAVVLWSQSRSTASRPLAQHIGAGSWGVRGARSSPEVMLAGPGWAGPPLPGMPRPHGLREALTTLARLYGTEPPAPGPEAGDDHRARGARRIHPSHDTPGTPPHATPG